MNIVLDSNVLLRWVQQGHAQQLIAETAMATLEAAGHELCLLPQNLYEFWVVSTRPTHVNGLGKTGPETTVILKQLRVAYPLLGDVPAVFHEWENLVTTHNVLGKPAHDARIAAAMAVHGLTHILTFNTGDFARYPAVTALDPYAVVGGTVP
jgi:predicted nucleic acid-binding protein